MMNCDESIRTDSGGKTMGLRSSSSVVNVSISRSESGSSLRELSETSSNRSRIAPISAWYWWKRTKCDEWWAHTNTHNVTGKATYTRSLAHANLAEVIQCDCGSDEVPSWPSKTRWIRAAVWGRCCCRSGRKMSYYLDSIDFSFRDFFL